MYCGQFLPLTSARNVPFFGSSKKHGGVEENRTEAKNLPLHDSSFDCDGPKVRVHCVWNVPFHKQLISNWNRSSSSGVLRTRFVLTPREAAVSSPDTHLSCYIDTICIGVVLLFVAPRPVSDLFPGFNLRVDCLHKHDCELLPVMRTPVICLAR